MKVSVITPSYNHGRFLSHTIQSALDQQSDQFQLDYMVCDNCSQDETVAVLARYSDQEKLKIKVERDQGQAHAIQQGIEGSNGDVVGWLNSDDVLMPGAIDHVVSLFKLNPGADVIYGEAHFINDIGEIMGRYPTANHNTRLLMNTCYLSQPSVFFRRELFDRVGGINRDYHYCFDYNLWLRFASEGAVFMKTDRYLSSTRIHQDTKTTTAGPAFAEEVMQMLLTLTGRIPIGWSIYSDYLEQVEYEKTKSVPKFFKSTVKNAVKHSNELPDLMLWLHYYLRNKVNTY